MKFQSDIIFKDYEYLFCRELLTGHQYFQSWEEFISLFVRYMNSSTKPLYCNVAHAENGVLYVDASQYVIIPWDELENYI